MRLNVLQCPPRPAPTTKDHLAQKVSDAKAERPQTTRILLKLAWVPLTSVDLSIPADLFRHSILTARAPRPLCARPCSSTGPQG